MRIGVTAEVAVLALALLPRDDDAAHLVKTEQLLMLSPTQATQLVHFIKHDGHTLAPLVPWLSTSSKARRAGEADSVDSGRAGVAEVAQPLRPFPPPLPQQTLAELVARLRRDLAAVLEAPAAYVGRDVVAHGLAHASKARLPVPVPSERIGDVETGVLVRLPAWVDGSPTRPWWYGTRVPGACDPLNVCTARSWAARGPRA